VEWLAPTFSNHQKRVFGAVRSSHSSQLYLNKIKERHEAGKFPKSIEDLATPKALDGLPSLQPIWDEVTAQYKQNLYHGLVNAREEKLATQYSPAIRDEIIKSLVGAVKKLCADKSTADPTHQPSFEAEGMATFTLFTKSITAWEQQAREQALQQFQKQQDKEDTNERQTLEQANVSDTQPRADKDTNISVDPYHWPATRPQVSPLPSEGQHQRREGQLLRRSIQRQQTPGATTEGHPGAGEQEEGGECKYYTSNPFTYCK
jgi:hypothetical protein